MKIITLDRTEITELSIIDHELIVKEMPRWYNGIYYAYFDGREEFGKRGETVDLALSNLADYYSSVDIKFDDGVFVKFPPLKHTLLTNK